MNRPHIIILLLFFFPVSLVVSSQQTRVKLSADRTSILIGERIQLFLEADIPETDPIRFFALDTIDHFEFLNRGKIDTINTSKGTTLRQSVVITSFDSGSFVIPPFVLDEGNDIRTDSLLVEVGYTPFDTAAGYHDVKDIIDVPVKEEEEDWLIYIIGAAAVVASLVFVYLTRKKKPAAEETVVVDHYREALDKAEQVNRTSVTAKELYSGLTDIFREFVFLKTGIHSLQQTTDDFMVRLKEINIRELDFTQLAQAMRQSDFVKFAKYEPGEEERLAFYRVIIESLKQVDRNFASTDERTV